MRAVVVALALTSLIACGDDLRGDDITIVTPLAWSPALTEFAALTPAAITVRTDQAESTSDFQIILVDDAAIPLEGFRIEPDGTGIWRVHTHDVLGAQYGAAAALENLGIRFRHPFDTYVPALGQDAIINAEGVTHQPEVRVRGFQLHTLHPLEGYFAFWEPGPGNASDARRTIDWLIKNRGNFLQWVALDDINDPAVHEKWKAHTRALLDYAHARGIRVGLNIQLFGQSNLQYAFDLSDDRSGTIPLADEIAARLPLVVTDLPFDVYALSFGEFFNAESQKFIDSVNEVQRQLATLAPAAEMHGVVHVGEEQRITFMGEDLIYYFLVKFASPAIIPDIHTVMYYNLFEDAGGAYHHANFTEHLDYLESRMCADQKAAYFPETAYWVAFDNSVPQWNPLYVRSRWLDLHTLKQRPCWPLDEHLIFSSGWEWGFWLNDVTALRGSYTVPDQVTTLLTDALPADTAAATAQVIDAQHEALIVKRLAAYLAGRDIAIDSGDVAGIVSQPDRITFADLVASADPAFGTTVMAPLATYADALDAIALPARADRWAAEVVDGLAIDRVRARFVLETYGAVL
nr:hypothetical protein [Deltaproteobacteria bacterium]